MNVTQAERSPERVRDELLVRCREERIEPPSDGRIDRMVRSALHRGEELLFSEVAARLPEPVRARLVALVEAVDGGDGDGDGDGIKDDDGSVVLASIRSDPGNVSLNTMLTEISKLGAVRAIGLSVGVFADIAPKVVAAWRGRAAVESPSHLRDHSLTVINKSSPVPGRRATSPTLRRAFRLIANTWPERPEQARRYSTLALMD